MLARNLVKLRQICLHTVKPGFNFIESKLVEKDAEENHQNRLQTSPQPYKTESLL